MPYCSCCCSPAPIQSHQSHPLVLTDLGNWWKGPEALGDFAVWVIINPGTDMVMPYAWTEMPSFQWWLSLQVFPYVEHIHYVPNVNKVLNGSILPSLLFYSNVKSGENGLILIVLQSFSHKCVSFRILTISFSLNTQIPTVWLVVPCSYYLPSFTFFFQTLLLTKPS